MCKENKNHCFYQKQKAKFGKCVIKQNISFANNVSQGWSESAPIIQQTWGKKWDFCSLRLAAALSQKSLRRPREEFKKGEGRTQVIYLKMSVSDNDVMLSSTSCPASLWDEGMSRTTPDTRLWLCPGIRRGSVIKLGFFFFRFLSYMHWLCLWESSRLCCSIAKDNFKESKHILWWLRGPVCFFGRHLSALWWAFTAIHKLLKPCNRLHSLILPRPV